jgi:hypothetical protein
VLINSHYRAYPDERRRAPLDGACLPSYSSRTDIRSAAQLVGSLVTKASVSPLEVRSRAPGVVGKSVEKVNPVT